jgi:hypothetical protein
MEVVGDTNAPTLSETSYSRGNIMNIHKHMEAIFVVALATAGLGSLALGDTQETVAGAAAPTMREVARSTAQGTAPVAMLCASRPARRT